MGGTCSTSAHAAVNSNHRRNRDGTLLSSTSSPPTATTTTSSTRAEILAATNREESGRPRLRIRNPTRSTITTTPTTTTTTTPTTPSPPHRRRFRRSLSAASNNNNNNNVNNNNISTTGTGTGTATTNTTTNNNTNTTGDGEGLTGDLHMMQLLFQAMVARAILDNLSQANNNNNNTTPTTTTTTPALTPAALAALASASENAQGLDGLETLLPFFAAAMGATTNGGGSESSAPPPASARVLERLPKAVVTERDLTIAGECNRECCICLVEHKAGDKEAAEEEVTRLPCGHLFHRSCAVEWLSKSCTCPVCRYELATDDASYEPGRLERMASRRVRLRLSELETMSARELKHLAYDTLRLSASQTSLEKTELVRRIVDCARVDLIDAQGNAVLDKKHVVLQHSGGAKMPSETEGQTKQE